MSRNHLVAAQPDMNTLAHDRTVRCPYCKEAILRAKGSARCRSCRAFHHIQCWESNGACSVFGCTGKEAIMYAGLLRRLFRWPSNAVFVFLLTIALLLAAGVFELNWLAHVVFSVAGFLCAFFFCLSFFKPDQNHLTRWMWDSCDQQHAFGSYYLLVLFTASVVIGTLNMLALIR